MWNARTVALDGVVQRFGGGMANPVRDDPMDFGIFIVGAIL